MWEGVDRRKEWEMKRTQKRGVIVIMDSDKS